MADDFFTRNARAKYADLANDLAEVNLGLQRSNAAGDDLSAQELIQGRANIREQMRNLEIEYDQYTTPRDQGVPTTESEFLSRAPERMGAEDVSRIFSKSKYFSPDQWSDPEVARRVAAGVAECARRRKAGA